MISDVHHVGIAVRDLAAALRFFSEALGLPVVKRGDAPARGASVALLAVGGGYLELVQPTSETSPFAAHVRQKGEGLHHVALRTGDVDSLVAVLRRKGVPLEDAEPREGFTGRLSYLAPQALDGALVEVVQPSDPSTSLGAGPAQEGPPPELSGGDAGEGAVKRIDHVVLRLPDVGSVCERMRDYFGIETKRTFERGEMRFSFLRPGDVVMELIGPREPPGAGPGTIAGLAFEVSDIDTLTAGLKARGLPVGEPHPALQGGRIVSVHPTGACGVPVAFIDFTDSHGRPG